ncbi:hypothetical protein [Kocuria carniphila]|uniref:hypothetical protein n=1 Tax=Kocuria carniphila TaxID=262208 RepID=UPI0034DB29A9
MATFILTLAGDRYDAERIFHQTVISDGAVFDDLNAHLAAIAGYWSNAICEATLDRPAGLLDYQQRSATGALAWLRSRIEKAAY